MGRTPREINWDIVEKMIEAECNGLEIAAQLRIDRDTFYDRFKLEYGKNFSDYSAEIHTGGIGNQKLVTHMRALSKNGPVALLIRYNEERLGWGKKEETKSPNQKQIDQSHLLMIKDHRIAELEKKLGLNANESKTE